MLNKKLSVSSSVLADHCSSSRQHDHPPLWRQAFYLADNVRFTRTPDCELIRKRAETDPEYAARLKEKLNEKLQEKQRQQQKIIQQEKEIMSQAVAPVELHENDMFSSLQAADETPKSPKYLNLNRLISDFAFFEAGPCLIDEGHIVAPPSDRIIEEVAGNAPLPVPAGSIIDLFRTLECRFPTQTPTQLPLSTMGGKIDACLEQHYQIAGSIAFTISGLSAAKPKTAKPDIQEEDIDWLAREAIETESLERENFEPQIEEGIGADNVEMETQTEASGSVLSQAPTTKMPVAVTPRCDNMLDPSASLLRPAHLVDDYSFPPLDLLQMPIYKDGAIISQETLERSAGLLENVLEDFGIKGEIIHVRPGPVVTLYEFEPAPGVKSSRIIGLSDDIARSMSAISTRVAVIPGRNVIGIELPNEVRDTVFLRELVQSKSFCSSDFKLALALGKNIGGEPIIAELAKMPHLLVAGTTGSGKSVAINTMILSLLYRLKPDQCRLIMVDPKMLELSIYDGIPHLLTPVVTDPKKAVTALKWAVREMEERYRKMAKLGVRNIDGFNERVTQAAQAGESITCTVQAGFDKETGELLYAQEAMDLTPLPYIVIIVDEMADLMMVAGKEIEGAIQRLAQMARAAGIHLIMATQRPSVDVITGTIKANFPTRISFQVTSRIDSRTILGEHGAETLLGQGDMLHMAGGGRIVRVHGAFVSDSEVEHIVAHLKEQGKPDYLATVTDSEEEAEDVPEADNIAEIVAAGGEDSEELYVQAVKVVMRDKKCSTSYIQRRLGVGYNKAASLVERMEREGLVGQANHVGKREILNQ